MKIVISGYYGSGNAGDEAILDAILQLLAELKPGLEVTVISVNPADTQARHKVKAVAHLDFWAVTKAVSRADLLISGGGSLLQNVTSWRSLYYYLAVIVLALLFRTKVMLFAQGIGPIFGDFARFITRLIINRVDLITVRDQGSLLELERLKVTRPHIECSADPALALRPVALDFGQEVLVREGLELGSKQMLIGLAVRRWSNFEEFKLQLAQALDDIERNIRGSRGGEVKFVFIPMQCSADVKAAKEIAALTLADCLVLEDRFSTDELLSIVGCMDILIGIRLHALIFAGVMKVPMVGISYDPKVDRFLDSIGEAAVAELRGFDSAKFVTAVLKKVSSSSSGVEIDLSRLRKLAERNVALAIELCG